MLLAATDIVARGGGNGGPGPLFIILLLGLLGFFLVRRYRTGAGGPHGSSPMSDLQRRFAAGEINQPEFEHRRAVLKRSKDIPPAPATMAPPSSFTGEPPVPPTPSESDEPDDSDDLP